MKTNHIKIQLPTLTTRDEAERAMTDLAQAANNQRKLIAKRDGEILKLNEQYEAPLSTLNQQLSTLSDSLRCWAEANPDQFPKDRKSIPMTSGTLGFRTGTPKLALLSRAWSWEKVIWAILDRGYNFIRVKQEVDKEAILAFVAAGPEPAAELEAKILKPIGLQIRQDETFFIEPDLTQFDNP